MQGPYQPDPNNPSWNCSVSNMTMPFYSMNPNQTVGGWATLNCTTRMPFMCRKQNSQGSPSMATQVTNETFYYNTTRTSFQDAENSCKNNGGHIAGFSTREEQREVEQYFISQGFLIPTWHTMYWYGSKTNSTLWPLFTHLYGPLGDLPDPYPIPDPTATPTVSTYYTNW